MSLAFLSIQSGTLATQQDTMLPKLLTGEARF